MWRQLRITLALNRRLARLRELTAHHGHNPVDDPALIWAAVAVILTPDPDSLLLIRRAERVGDPWSGHMALPGGRRDSTDEDLVRTVIREASEEVGVSLSPDHLAGRLEDVVPRTPVLPPIAVRPFVFLPTTRPGLILNPEVASAHWILIDELLAPGAYHDVRLEIAGQSRDVPAFQLKDGIVWGMTERILSSLLQSLRA